jgi:hypothetical protein
MELYEYEFWGGRWAFAKWMVQLADEQAERQMRRYVGLWEVLENERFRKEIRRIRGDKY